MNIYIKSLKDFENNNFEWWQGQIKIKCNKICGKLYFNPVISSVCCRICLSYRWAKNPF